MSYGRRNNNVFSLCRKVTRDVAVLMSSGSEFHNLAAMTGKTRLVAKCGASCSRNTFKYVMYCCTDVADLLGCLCVTGFLQVRENRKKSGNLSGQGKVRGKYFFWKSQGKWKIGVNRCQFFCPKCIKFDFRWGSAPDPTGGAYSAPPVFLAALNIVP